MNNASSKHKRLENLWLWTVAVVFTVAGFATCFYWMYIIAKFIREAIYG